MAGAVITDTEGIKPGAEGDEDLRDREPREDGVPRRQLYSKKKSADQSGRSASLQKDNVQNEDDQNGKDLRRTADHGRASLRQLRHDPRILAQRSSPNNSDREA